MSGRGAGTHIHRSCEGGGSSCSVHLRGVDQQGQQRGREGLLLALMRWRVRVRAPQGHEPPHMRRLVRLLLQQVPQRLRVHVFVCVRVRFRPVLRAGKQASTRRAPVRRALARNRKQSGGGARARSRAQAATNARGRALAIAAARDGLRAQARA